MLRSLRFRRAGSSGSGAGPFGDGRRCRGGARGVVALGRTTGARRLRNTRIGESAEPARRFAAHDTSQGEQKGVEGANGRVLQALADANRSYERRFGYIFIVCASGRSADEMLTLLQERLGNDPETEIGIAAAEQANITELRLARI